MQQQWINKMMQNDDNIEHFDITSCNEYISHVLKCKKCYNIIKNKMNIMKNTNNHLDNFLTNDIKEIIIIIIIGIFIILILHIFVKIINNKLI
jgi:hypothetical protein